MVFALEGISKFILYATTFNLFAQLTFFSIFLFEQIKWIWENSKRCCNLITILFRHIEGQDPTFPENTMLAFNEAAAAGVRSIETDLSILADNSFALFHDAILGRTVDGDCTIGTSDANVLCNYDAGKWRGLDFAGEPIPAMADALKWQQETDIGFNWEIKPHISSEMTILSHEYVQLCERYANALTKALGGC